MRGCECTISAPGRLLYLEAGRCSNCCGERQCFLSCLVLSVCIWHRQGKSHSVLSFPSMLCVEIVPIGADIQAKRTEVGKRRRTLKTALSFGEETWTWEPQDNSSDRTNCMTFQVPPSGQLRLNVLESPADWWHVGASPHVLGEARISIGEDILSVLDAKDLSKEWLEATEGNVVSREIRRGEKNLLQHAHLPTFAGSTRAHGKLCHPLIADKRVCGEIVLDLTVCFEDPVAEFQELLREFNLSHNPCAKAGTTTDFMNTCQERTSLAASPPEDEMWSPRALTCAADGTG